MAISKIEPAGLQYQAGTGPAFSAYLSTNQTVTTGVLTKLAANTEEFDTNSNYDNSTNYRFTPTVAGYYQISGGITGAATSVQTVMVSYIYKNGVQFKGGSAVATGTGFAGGGMASTVSVIIYMNGSTDYVEYYGRVDGTGTCSMYANSYFQGCLVRAA